MFNNHDDWYSVSELASLLECSLPVAKKKALAVHSKDLAIRYKVFNGKKIAVYYVPKDTLIELKDEILKNKIKFAKEKVFNEQLQSAVAPEDTAYEVVKTSSEGNLLYDLMSEYKNDIKSIYEAHHKELLNANLQIRLLEDSENRKENEYLGQIADFKAKEKRFEILKICFVGALVIAAIFAGLFIYKLKNPTVVEKTVIKTVVKTVPAKVVKRR